MHCQKCGSELILLDDGHGCGGMGSKYGCEKCDAVFVQMSGGVISTVGPVSLSLVETLSKHRSREALREGVSIDISETADLYN